VKGRKRYRGSKYFQSTGKGRSSPEKTRGDKERFKTKRKKKDKKKINREIRHLLYKGGKRREISKAEKMRILEERGEDRQNEKKKRSPRLESRESENLRRKCSRKRGEEVGKVGPREQELLIHKKKRGGETREKREKVLDLSAVGGLFEVPKKKTEQPCVEEKRQNAKEGNLERARIGRKKKKLA